MTTTTTTTTTTMMMMISLIMTSQTSAADFKSRLISGNNYDLSFGILFMQL